jgi:tryptophan synthase beta chain
MGMKESQIRLAVEELPTSWYNILADLPEKLPPPKDPKRGPSRIERLPKIFLRTVLEQEFAEQRLIRIPEEVRELYIQAGRPRPLHRALRLEKKLGLEKVKLYYKREDLSPTGSHKVNTALAQCFFAKEEGKQRVVTETGAGQWGSALAYAASLLGLDCTIYMVRHAYQLKPERVALMKVYGAEVFASPSKQTRCGRELYEKNREHPGSLGIAISESIEDVLSSEESVYCLGSVLNHVLLHQTIIGLEAKKQFEKANEYPDVMIGCLGGGSNFGGFILPFVKGRLAGKKQTRFIASQSQAAPNLVKGSYRYDFGDYAEHTPLIKMYTLGHKAELKPIYAEGLRYHGAAPIMSYLRKKGILEAIAYPTNEKEVFQAARIFAQTEGFLPAPESAYAIRAAIDEALKAKGERKEKVIAFNISGHGFLDLKGYKSVLGL